MTQDEDEVYEDWSPTPGRMGKLVIWVLLGVMLASALGGGVLAILTLIR